MRLSTAFAMLLLALCACRDAGTEVLPLTASTRVVMRPGDLSLTATSGALSLTRVEFFEGASRLGEAAAAPFVLPVPISAADNGPHRYRAVGHDAQGHAYESLPVDVTVDLRGEPDLEGMPNLTVRADLLARDVTVGRELFAEGCDAEEYGVPAGEHSVMRFTTAIANVGDADAFVGDPLAHHHAGDGLFEHSPCHNHFHMRFFMEYALVSVDTGQVWTAAKRSFCLRDIDRNPEGAAGPVRAQPLYGYCGSPTEVGFQGISPGWSDVYQAELPGQFVLLDGSDGQRPVPPGEYLLRLTVNPPFTPSSGELCRVQLEDGRCRQLAESSYADNSTVVRVVVPAQLEQQRARPSATAAAECSRPAFAPIQGEAAPYPGAGAPTILRTPHTAPQDTSWLTHLPLPASAPTTPPTTTPRPPSTSPATPSPTSSAPRR